MPALPAGDYFFLCTLHPTTMTGTMSLSEGGGPTVVAQDLAFDTDLIVLPPDLESTITLDNEDAGTEHNIAIYTDESASEAIFQGQPFPGVATETYTVPAVAPGEYYFHCDVHPDMHGDRRGRRAAGGRRRGADGRGTTARRLGPAGPVRAWAACDAASRLSSRS